MKSVKEKSDKTRMKEAMKHFDRIKEIVAQHPSPFEGMKEDEVIERLRETREKLWRKKLGLRV